MASEVYQLWTLEFKFLLFKGQLAKKNTLITVNLQISLGILGSNQILDADTLSSVYTNILSIGYSQQEHDHAQAPGAASQSRNSGVGSVRCTKASMQPTQHGYSERMVGSNVFELRLHR